jgi:GT2 family glycosyltransferase
VRRRIRAVAVVVPVHDEQELLAACVRSVRAALASCPVAARGVLVLDACTDASAEIAAASGLAVVEISAARVGSARAAGVAEAIAGYPDVRADELWLAHTDADSSVPVGWLARQVEMADAGADVYVGTVTPDFRDLDAAQRAAWLVTHEIGVANGHVHGANLGVRASTLLTVGGFAPVDEHEDVDLVDRIRGMGARVVADAAADVKTSGRPVGRTPGGYARYLREDLVSRARAKETMT